MKKMLKGSIGNFEKDFIIERYSGEIAQVKQGDKFRVENKIPSGGSKVTIISGEARDCMILLDDIECDEQPDAEEVTNSILKILNRYNIKDYIEQDELEAIKDDIFDYLSNF